VKEKAEAFSQEIVRRSAKIEEDQNRIVEWAAKISTPPYYSDNDKPKFKNRFKKKSHK
jgi:hypothetical protein